jgi:hypothetical protein
VHAPVDSLAIASLVVGILALCAAWVLPFDYLILALPAMILGGSSIEVTQQRLGGNWGKGSRRMMAMVGVVLGAVAAIISLVVFGIA